MGKSIKIGIIKGKGTGHELSVIFKSFIEKINEKLKLPIEFQEQSIEFETFWSLHNKNINYIQKKTNDNVIALNKVFDSYFENVDIIFRTGINAESLYILRQKYRAIKEFLIPLKKGNILMIRDQMQGFYANSSYQLSNNELTFNGKFSKNNIKKLIHHSKNIADNIFNNNEYNIIAIYKYHLFGNVIEKWFSSIDSQIKLYQPDTGISLLLNELKQTNGNTVLIVSNEVGDILYEFLIEHFGLGNKNELFTKNIYFKNNKKIIVYQTVHGSADDIAKQNKVNPIATIRIAAKILDSVQSKSNITELVENSIKKLHEKKILTFDLKESNTTEIVFKELTKNVLNSI